MPSLERGIWAAYYIIYLIILAENQTKKFGKVKYFLTAKKLKEANRMRINPSYEQI